MEGTKELITTDDIRSNVYIIRGQQVMLDKDLAELYGYEVKRLNEQVKRNISRFPEDFMFQLNKEEIPEKFSKSQIATLNEKSNRQGSNIKKMPFAFTEQGIYMLATVLRGELAEQQSIFIMRTFREMRHYIKQNQQFVTRSEMELLSSKVTEISVQTAGLIDKQKQTDQKVDLIQKNVEQLSENFISEKDVKNFVIYKGQKLEADIAYIEIYQQAKKSIYVVDDYMNAKSLQHLSQKVHGVEVVLFTEKRYLPKDLEVLTGFILRPAVKTGLKNRSRKNEVDSHSTQLDILIYDSAKYPIFQRFGENVIVPPEGVAGIISVKKNLHENDIVHEAQALKAASKLCRCVDDNGQHLRGPFLALVSMDAFEKKEKTTEQWIFEKLEGVYSKEDDYFDDLIGYIGSFNKWSIFKRRPQDGEVGEYIFFNHSEEEAHMGFQFLLTGILSVYYDKTRNYISRPGFTAFPSHRACDKKLGDIEVRAIR